jgi:hypothetical protein
VIVHLADGSTVPLRGWSLSYEYVAWPPGSSQALGTTERRESQDLWIAGTPNPHGGSAARAGARHGFARSRGGRRSGPAEIPTVRRLRLTWPDGRKQEFRAEPPRRELLRPGGPKNLVVVARSLDLQGRPWPEYVAELCVLSYTSLVECGVERAGRVVKLEFPGRGVSGDSLSPMPRACSGCMMPDPVQRRASRPRLRAVPS